MQKKRIAAIIAASMVGSTGVAQAAEGEKIDKWLDSSPFIVQQQDNTINLYPATPENRLLVLLKDVNEDSKKAPVITLKTAPVITIDLPEKKAEPVQEVLPEPPVVEAEPEPEPILEPRYGVDFTRIRAIFPNRPFVKKVLTDEMKEHLNKREAETGIPGAAIVAQAIWEVGWDLNTPKGGGRDSMNLFNIKNCDGNYVVMIGCKWQCYNSYIESVDSYIELITTQPRYAKAYEHIKNGGDIKTYYRMLGDAGYYEASKDTYSNSCMSIINANGLLAK